ncbi:MAG: hypothetical protein D6731_05380 [Planctomycetota bacterium]|nr:MAG: hypothetical protein D6731_05380 [Planctomycetota bacterium]
MPAVARSGRSPRFERTRPASRAWGRVPVRLLPRGVRGLEGPSKLAFLGALVVFLAGAVAPRGAWADEVALRNGRVLQGVRVRERPNGFEVLLPGGTLYLAAHEVDRVVRSARPAARRLAGRASLGRLARDLEAAWRVGDTAKARRLLASDPRVHVLEGPGLSVRADLVRAEGSLRLRVRVRRRGPDPALLALPPGTGAGGALGVCLLRPAALVLGPGAERAEVLLPVLYAHPDARPSEGHLRLTLSPDPARRRLLAVLCAGVRPPPETAAQLALWTLPGRLRREDLVEAGPRLTPGRALVLPLHAEHAARLLRSAGLEPRRRAFFRRPPLPGGAPAPGLAGP